MDVQHLFESLTAKEGIFYRSQQKDEADLSKSEKIAILGELYRTKPVVFLERYYQHIEPKFADLFSGNDPQEKFILEQIKSQNNDKRAQLVKNRRYLAIQALRAEGSYFSNEKMREREPYLFDLMVGQYLDDKEKLHLRPTVEITDANKSDFSVLLEQLDETQRVSERRNRYLDNFQKILDDSDYTDRFMSHVDHRTIEADEAEQELELESEFHMEFDSSDEEGREQERIRQINAIVNHGTSRTKHCAKNDSTFVMRRFRDRNVLKSEDERAGDEFAELRVSQKVVKKDKETDEWSSGDEDESRPTGLMREQLFDEFVSLMEQRFLEGKDVHFFDYSQVDAGHGIHGHAHEEMDKIREQDLEDAYFDAEESE